MWARDDFVPIARLRILDLPFAITRWIPGTANLEVFVVPIRGTNAGDAGIVELPHQIIAGRNDVEIEPPINVMVVRTAVNPNRGRIVPSACNRHSVMYRYQPACILLTSATSGPCT
jgi:hypothetical protein